MYSFNILLELYNKTNDYEYYKKNYEDNLIYNINNNLNQENSFAEDNNFLLDYILINKIHYNIENNIKYIYILIPVLYINIFLFGFKQFIYMVK